MEKTFTTVKEVFVNDRSRNKNLIQFMHRYYYLREIPNYSYYRRVVVLLECSTSLQFFRDLEYVLAVLKYSIE